jgi:hypothetical protein
MREGWNIERVCTGVLFAVLATNTSGQANSNVAQDQSATAIEGDYESTILPLLSRYCFECHSGDLAEAEINLAEYTTAGTARKQVKTWQKIRKMLETEQMPPEDSLQPTDAERLQLKTWVRDFLTHEAKRRAGDPGSVILRRLSNDEYNYTIHDLTGVESLDPTREFPVDGAAGEGFTNTGSAQAMSPALVTKYLDAAKEVASHVVLLPDGIRFSPHVTRRDHTDELLARIQAFYRRFTEDGGGTEVNLDSNPIKTNQDGLLAVENFLAATLEERDALLSGSKSLSDVARTRSLNYRYLATLWQALTREVETPQSLLLDRLRQNWNHAKPGDEPALSTEIAQIQKALWKFNLVGQLGGEGTQKTWMEPVTPIVSRQELRLPLSPLAQDSDVVIYLAANDLGDGRDHDFVVWDQPRIEFQPEASGQSHPPIFLRDVNELVGRTRQVIASEVPKTALYLEAVAKLRSPSASQDEVASSYNLDALLLKRWAKIVGLGGRHEREIHGHFASQIVGVQGYEALNGWGHSQTPSLLTNRSDGDVSFLTLTIPARSVVVHPSPTQESVIAWRSPLFGKLQIEGLVADTDNKCGNGAAWRVELLSESGMVSLASGVIDNGGDQQLRREEEIDIREGDVISLIVNARDNSHSCDTTHVDFTLSEVGGEGRKWNLSSDVVDRVLDANPLPDSYGHAETWHFGATDNPSQSPPELIPNSALAHWRSAVVDSKPVDDIRQLAASVQNALTSTDISSLSEPDRTLRELLEDWKGPLQWTTLSKEAVPITDSGFGLDSELFGRHPNGSTVEMTSLCLQAPQVLQVRLPQALVTGAEFVVSSELHAPTGEAGSVQVQVLTAKPDALQLSMSSPILARPGSEAHRRIDADMTEFRNLFPAALCYTRIVPVDEVVTMTLFFREDEHLKRLMLDDEQVAQLERLWDELLYVNQEPIALTVAFEQISEFATQDRPDLVTAFEPMRKPINDRADVFRARLLKTEPAHVDAVLEFASRAWRRPLSEAEQLTLRDFYRELRDLDIDHEGAIRLTLARTLSSPAFLYRHEEAAPGKDAAPVSSVELANRLSYFLWSTTPDAELRQVADSEQLVSDGTLINQTHRMLKGARTRRLAVQFACQWLHLRNFDKNDDKNEKRYPEFASLRGDMYEETVRFFEDMFRNDGSILGLLNADHTFLNEALAKHYGMEGVVGSEWQRVDGVRAKGRGGILGMATLLASQSGASRTSPILRGNWIYETLLGERLPRPPATVPQLPEDIPDGLTARQLIEQHSGKPECARCHVHIDAYGFALEQYDAIGRLRATTVDTKTKLENGRPIEGIDGLRDYLLTERRNDVIRQFCRKLLGFALGRETLPSDEMLLGEMLDKLEAHEFRFSVAIETIVTSEQFRRIRGREYTDE